MLAIELEVVTLQNKCKKFDQGFCWWVFVGPCFPDFFTSLDTILVWYVGVKRSYIHGDQEGVLGQRTKGIFFPQKSVVSCK